MKMRLTYLVVFLSLPVLFLCSNTFAENRLSEQQAQDILKARVQKDKLYDRWTTMSCLSFLVEEKTKDYIDIAIREKHDGQCPGDPDTSPTVDRFRVHRITKRIKWYEPAKGEFQSYSAVLKTRVKNDELSLQ
jgi:hypothetical protein